MLLSSFLVIGHRAPGESQSREIQSKNKLVCEKTVTGIHRAVVRSLRHGILVVSSEGTGIKNCLPRRCSADLNFSNVTGFVIKKTMELRGKVSEKR